MGSKISAAEPIQSRCAILHYSKLEDNEVSERLKEVCKEERVSYENTGIDALVFTAQGDMRQVKVFHIPTSWIG